MLLKKYQAKRKFEKTPEPKGKVVKKNLFRFVIHKHQARNLHYDLRLEMEGVLKSWAVPKEPPKISGIKRLAMQVENHPVDYINFQGIIPAGNYGAGKVEIWDEGSYKLIKKAPNEIEFELMGNKLKGNYVLIKPRGSRFGEKAWLFLKKRIK
jgi:DNA ligase D-like protein (predicted 3'-phosphoesterase)